MKTSALSLPSYSLPTERTFAKIACFARDSPPYRDRNRHPSTDKTGLLYRRNTRHSRNEATVPRVFHGRQEAALQAIMLFFHTNIVGGIAVFGLVGSLIDRGLRELVNVRDRERLAVLVVLLVLVGRNRHCPE